MATIKTKIGAVGISLLLIAGFEGIRVIDYWDGYGGVSTACFGHTETAKVGTQRTVEGCENLLIEDVRKYQSIVLKHTKRELTDYQLAAITSFVYNVGETNYKNSTLLRKINSGYHVGKACLEELPRWNKAKGIVLRGLTKRRADEAKICNMESLEEIMNGK